MATLEILHQIGQVGLVIPAWQMALYMGLISIFTLMQRRKLCLIITYIFTLYWGFYLFGGDLLEAFGGSPQVLSIYIICGLVILGLFVFACFQEES